MSRSKLFASSFILLLLFLGPVAILIGNSDGDETQLWQEHGAIRIKSDLELTQQATLKGWSGTGSENDPIIISNLTIDVDKEGGGIFIANTTLNLLIKNCTIFNSSIQFPLELRSVHNCNFREVRMNDSIWGAVFQGCWDILLIDSNFSSIHSTMDFHQINGLLLINTSVNSENGEAVTIWNSNNIFIKDNTIEFEDDTGLSVYLSSFINIINNTIFNTAIESFNLLLSNCAVVNVSKNYLLGGETIHIVDCIAVHLIDNEITSASLELKRSPITARSNIFHSSGILLIALSGGEPWLGLLDVDRSNIVNDDPICIVRSYVEIEDLPEDVGQLLLLNVDNGSVSVDLNEPVTVGIQGIGCTNITIFDTTIYNPYYGIFFTDCSDSLIENSSTDWARHNGFFMNYCTNLSIIDNTILNTTGGSGIYLRHTNESSIHGNTIYHSIPPFAEEGLFLSGCHDNDIWNNYFFYNSETGDYYKPSKFQAFDLIGINRWNSTNGIGNYWRDWRTPDDNEDGIVDVPYTIGASGAAMPQDYYPMTTCPVVAPPTNVTFTPYENLISLEWKEPIQTNYTKIMEYNVHRQRVGPGPIEIFSIIAAIGPGTTSYTDMDVSYYYDEFRYFITAVNQLTESDPSELVFGSLDELQPFINITSPLNGSYHNTEDIVVTWEATDNQSGIQKNEIRIDEGPWTDIGLNTSHEFTGLPEGSHRVQIAVTDNASLRNMANVTFHIDLTLPHLDLLSPQDGELITSRVVTVSWEGMDNGSGIEGYQVRADCCNWTTSDWDTGHTFIFNDDGIHAVEIAAVDRAGNRLEKAVSFIIDSYLPEITILTPEDGLMSQDGMIKVTWAGEDNGTGLEGYWFRVNDWEWTDMGDQMDKTLWSLYDGIYKIQVKAADLAGNIKIDEVVVTVDGTLPRLHIITPVDGSFISASPVPIMWSGSDATSGIDHYEIRLGENQWVDVGYENTYTIVNLAEGQYRFSIRATDRAGNSITLTTSFTLDQTRPEFITYSPQGNDVDPDEVISVTFSERMHKPTIQFRVSDVQGSVKWKGDRLIFVPKENLSYGKEYEITVLGWDLAGNRVSTLIWSFRTTSKGTVQGYIVDRNDRPIEFARIYVKDGNETRSREEGFFTLDLESGIRTIVVEAEGYRTVEVPLEIEPGQTYNIDKLIMSREGEGSLSPWSCLLMATLIIMSLAAITALALYLGSRRQAGELEEE